MNVRPTAAALAFLLSSLFATAIQASPITVSCPGTAATTDREFSFTFDNSGGGTATCLQYGDGNDYGPFAGYSFIEKDQASNNGGLSGYMTTDATFGSSKIGSINFDPSIASQDLLLVLKSGVGQADPDWVVFALTPTILSGTFNIVSPGQGQQSISHMELYGSRGIPEITQLSTTPVPEPASLLLFGTGLLGVGRMARKRFQARQEDVQ